MKRPSYRSKLGLWTDYNDLIILVAKILDCLRLWCNIL